MGKLVDDLRKRAKKDFGVEKDAEIDEIVLLDLDELWRKKIDEGGLALEWSVTAEAIPIIEECLEKGDGAALRAWERDQVDAIPDGVDW